MSETREFDGPDWRENPDEFKPPVRRNGNFLATRGYQNAEIAAVKFGLAEDIQLAVARLNMTQAAVAARVTAAGTPLAQPDVSAILNGNVTSFALERLIQVAAALGTNVTISSGPGRDGRGHIHMRRPRIRQRAMPKSLLGGAVQPA